MPINDGANPYLKAAPTKGLIWAFIATSFLGFLDATFLTAEYYFGALLSCPIFRGCDKVLTSSYSAIAGIPVALAGAVYYLTLFLLSIAYWDTGRLNLFRFAANLTLLGFIASLWFLYLQVFIIKALCFYCLISLATSTLLFFLGFVWYFRFSRNAV
jgi:uncharacterized membrane protein